MSQNIKKFKPGSRVEMTCYKDGCENVSIPVVLGQEYDIHPTFVESLQKGKIGRFFLATAKRIIGIAGFELGETLGGSGYTKCPKCGTLFGGVIVVAFRFSYRKLIFGYDPGPVL